ncbi:hypothetical protein ACS0TY_026429 [Phlomoides rotata]
MDVVVQPAVSVVLDRLTQLIIQETDQLSRVRVELRGIEEEIEFMASLLERSEALQIHDNVMVKDKMKSFIMEAETLIEDYATIASQRSVVGSIKMIIYERKHEKRLNNFIVKLREYKPNLTEYDLLLRGVHLPEGGGPHDQSDEVPRYLRRFIYYFLLFPANFEIPARRLIVLWVAENLIRPSITNVNESVEDIAERDLNALINLGVVRATKRKLNGKTQACSLEVGNQERDKWLKEAKEANFFQNRTKKVCRLVDQTMGTRARGDADADSSFVRIHGNPGISNSVPGYGDVISFLSLNTQEGSKPGEDIGNFLHECIVAERFLWLRVMDLEKVFRPMLPETLGKLTRLKYLGLRWTYLQHLPDFVNKLLQLQVLDVKHTCITLLPRSIWKMKDLRHLYLSEAYRTRFPDRPSGVLSLNELQTLWGAFIDEDTHVEGGLDTLEGIQKLGLSCRPRSSSGDSDNMLKQLVAVDKWITELDRLRSLRLKSRDMEGEAADLHLTTLEKNTNLSTVYLLGKLNPHVVEKFPQSLTDITLSGSELNEDPMGFLGRLPNLQILRLLAKSVLHPKLHCSAGGFPRLKVVHIWCLENLEEWQVEEGSLLSLEELGIRSCQNLVKLPDQLQRVKKLQKFWLQSMPNKFMNETEITQPQLWDKIKQTREAEQ